MEPLRVSDREHTTPIVDDPFVSQRRGGLADSGAGGPDHLGEEFVRELEAIRVRPLSGEQEPSREPLHRRMEAIAERRLRQLVHHPLRIIHEQPVQCAAREDVLADQFLWRAIRKTRQLNDKAVRQWLISEGIGDSRDAFSPDERNLDRVPLLVLATIETTPESMK